MSGTASGLVLGFLLATAYGAAFHFIMGGPARRIILYVVMSWIGFAVGHFIGNLLGITLFTLGALHLFSASIGAWLALILSWWFVRKESR